MNEKQQALVKEYMDMFGFSEEQAIEMLTEEGKMNEGGAKISFKPELPELKFFTGALASPMTKHNKLAKKAKIKTEFEPDNFYLGTKIVKVGEGDEKTIDPAQTEIGLHIGETAEIVVCSQAFYAGYYNQKSPNLSVTTNMIFSMFDKKNAFDFKTGKTVDELYETGNYGDKKATGQDKTIKWTRVVGLLVNTEDGWKKAFTEKKIGVFESDTFHGYLESVGDAAYRYLGKTELVEYEVGNSYRVVKDRVLTDVEIKEIGSLVMEVKKEMQRVVKEQSEFTKAKRDGGDTLDSTDKDTSKDEVTNDNELDLDEVFGDED